MDARRRIQDRAARQVSERVSGHRRPGLRPAGWDEWDSPTSGGNPYSEYNYRLNENGNLVRYGTTPQDYLVDVLSRKSSEFIQQKSNKPFFLYVAPYVPHLPATPAPRYADAFPGVQAPRTPSFNEADMSAEPQWLQNRPVLNDQQIATIDQAYRKRLQSMLGVEDLIENVVDTLQKTGQLDNTYIVFSSDNGFHLGQHRLPPGKMTAFEEDIHVPLVVRGPDVPEGKKADDLAMNIDLAPTFADLGGAKTPSFVNGRSLATELHGKKPDHERKNVLVEHYAESPRGQRRRNTGASAQQDPDNDTSPPNSGTPTTGSQAPTVRRGQFQPLGLPEYAALRTDRYTYVEYVTGERQLYDLRADPDRLHNIVSTADPKLVQDLAERLSDLQKCKGSSCRVADRG